MPLQGRAKVRYQREYMRKQRAGLPRTAPKSRCMLCLKAASADRILIGNGAGYVCEACIGEAASIILAKRAQRKRHLHTL